MPSTPLGQLFTTVLIEAHLIEQRYHPCARFSPALLKEARKARERITRRGACAVLVVIPPEIPLDPPSTNEDHLREESQGRSILALAVVAENVAMNTATKFYFRYYPQAFETMVFTEEEDARAWLNKQLSTHKGLAVVDGQGK